MTGFAPPATATNDAIRAAMARVEKSLAIVLAEIAKIQAEMHQTSPPATIIPLRPETWAGSPLRTRYGRTSR